jgi:hypothetical protein
MDYVDEITRHGAQPSDKQISLIIETIDPLSNTSTDSCAQSEPPDTCRQARVR